MSEEVLKFGSVDISGVDVSCFVSSVDVSLR